MCSFIEPALPALTHLRAYLRSSGRYGPSPFLVGHYGGLGEIAQGFCRAAAVAGAVYILGHSTIDVERIDNGKYAFKLNDIPDTLTADVLLSAQDLVPPNIGAATTPTLSAPTPKSESEAVARAVLILDGPLTFPPSSASASTATDDTEDGGAGEGGNEEEAEEKTVDTAVIVFPPAALPGGSTSAAVHAFITGQGTMSAPAGKCTCRVFSFHIRD